MAEKLTPQQREAVENRGGKLLVSAAAGSGKTKVLVDRLMGYLTDPVDPANIDEFLIITYTKAAASELRGKIAAKLSERIAQESENRHLQQQLQRLYMTNISTVHSFCGDLLRQFAYRLDLSADFRVADEGECRQIRSSVMEQVLEAAYETAGEDLDFCAFVDTQGIGRNDRKLPEVLLKVYDSAMCHLNPDEWLNKCLASVDIRSVTDVSQTTWGAYLMEELFYGLGLQIAAMERCAQLAAKAQAMEKPAALLEATVRQLRHLRESKTWDEILQRKSIDYGRLTFTKKITDLELKEGIQAVRESCKDSMEQLLRPFADPSEQVLKDLAESAPAVRGMVKLVLAFRKAYEAAKRSKRILDFSDLEHRALDLLYGKSRTVPTAIAHEVGLRFREVMVDEYQDSNAVQDAIYSALTGRRQNCFMVGDVKQSIYQFRLADPGIFLEKYKAFCPAEEAASGEGRKVLLSSNFRSAGAVLSAVNDVFARCMSPKVGGLHYGEDEALHEGIPHIRVDEPEVELYCVQTGEDAYGEEAAFVVQRIRELLDGTHMIRTKEALRPIKAEDIVILLRSPGSVGEVYRRALEDAGIRCTSGGGSDLLKTEEIAVLRSLLQTIHNPQLDIPLVATLASPLFGFTADDLAALRSKNKKCSIFQALQQDDSPKTRSFLQVLQQLRQEARMAPLSRVLESVFTVTGIDTIYAAMSDGETKSANLQAFYQLAVTFEAGGQQDLGYFLEHLEASEEKGLVSNAQPANAGCVTIMSIHKSKGLEFPVVFLCGLSRGFNTDSQRAQVLCHKELGIGISAANGKRRVRYPTVAKRAIAAKIGEDGLSEELRVLYVAMTRAKDRLIMTYASGNLEKKLKNMAARMKMGCDEMLPGEANCPGDWILQAALHRMEAGELLRFSGTAGETTMGEYPWLIQVVYPPEAAVCQQSEEENQGLPKKTVEQIRQSLLFRYPHPEAVLAPSKQTATQRKGRIKDQEVAELAQEPKTLKHTWRKPTFVSGEVEGKTYGSAVHAVLQYIRYEACTDVTAVEQEIQRLEQEGFISKEQADMVKCEQLAAFFATPVGTKLRSSKDVLREFKFSILDDGGAYTPGLEGEKILLQGVVDCALLEADGITVVDFKTDRVNAETLPAVAEGYRPQVEAYAEALSRIYQMPIKKSYLYFFHIHQFVEV